MVKIIKENIETYVTPVYCVKSGKIAFYEKVTNHFIEYDNGDSKLTVIRKKISKKIFEKLSKNP